MINRVLNRVVTNMVAVARSTALSLIFSLFVVVTLCHALVGSVVNGDLLAISGFATILMVYIAVTGKIIYIFYHEIMASAWKRKRMRLLKNTTVIEVNDVKIIGLDRVLILTAHVPAWRWNPIMRRRRVEMICPLTVKEAGRLSHQIDMLIKHAGKNDGTWTTDN